MTRLQPDNGAVAKVSQTVRQVTKAVAERITFALSTLIARCADRRGTSRARSLGSDTTPLLDAPAEASLRPHRPMRHERRVLGTTDVLPRFRPRLQSSTPFSNRYGTALVSGGTGGRGLIQVRGASVPGLDHAHSGEPGQDAAAVGYRGDEVLLAVADGVGSLVASHLAAATATAQVLSHAFENQGRHAQHRLSDAYRHAAASIGTDQGSTTLMSALLRPTTRGRVEAELASVGNTAAWRLRADGRLEELLCERGERTRALPRAADDVQPLSVDLQPGEVLLLCSDGFYEALLHPDSSYLRYIEEHWKSPPAESDFVADVMFDADFFYDDRTVVAAWIPDGHP
ncbi:protein phosphatase 2C domain-containing protein [Streptomyces sp. NPDC005077]|uniref:PP2C family protein-serine/threonine phosphatase n=1 Tax=Streptomyces sp. NPDC005077 TaxID=3154292 RepID=UPI0033BD6498